ncbi:uncharacterized protein LOC131803143 [Musca domestica]|uniref:Uncharacterized protein LOC131803143 n=1 Tax=Musca domestica TaxID=7370 RepID=A0ABM3V351_MUSDO|nr:uncharacterized protein LOC131803143 [Musca domestica]
MLLFLRTQIFLLFVGFFNFGHCQIFRVISYRHELDANYIKWTTLDLFNQTINGCVVLARDMEKFLLRIEAVSKTKKNAKPWTLFNITVDGCSVLGDGRKNKPIYLVDTVVRAVKKQNPRMPQQCPMKKDTEYCYDNFTMSSIKFTHVLPHIEANINISLWRMSVASRGTLNYL